MSEDTRRPAWPTLADLEQQLAAPAPDRAARREPGAAAYRGVVALLVAALACVALQWLAAVGVLS